MQFFYCNRCDEHRILTLVFQRDMQMNSQILWDRILFEKLIVIRFFKKFRILNHIHKIPSSAPILSYMTYIYLRSR